MLAFFDHDDFKSSRKSVVVTSVTILILASFHISGKTLNIAGLDFAFDKDRLNLLLKVALIYFLVVFTVRCYIAVAELLRDVTTGRFEQRLRNELEFRAQEKELREKEERKSGQIQFAKRKLAKSDEEIIKNAKSAKAMPYERLIAALNMASFLFIEVMVPFALGSWALFKPMILANFIDGHLDSIIN